MVFVQYKIGTHYSLFSFCDYMTIQSRFIVAPRALGELYLIFSASDVHLTVITNIDPVTNKAKCVFIIIDVLLWS